MKKRYVISASEFKTKKGALAKIQEWNDGDGLDNDPKVYEVTKKFKTVLALKEEKLK